VLQGVHTLSNGQADFYVANGNLAQSNDVTGSSVAFSIEPGNSYYSQRPVRVTWHGLGMNVKPSDGLGGVHTGFELLQGNANAGSPGTDNYSLAPGPINSSLYTDNKWRGDLGTGSRHWKTAYVNYVIAGTGYRPNAVDSAGYTFSGVGSNFNTVDYNTGMFSESIDALSFILGGYRGIYLYEDSSSVKIGIGGYWGGNEGNTGQHLNIYKPTMISQSRYAGTTGSETVNASYGTTGFTNADNLILRRFSTTAIDGFRVSFYRSNDNYVDREETNEYQILGAFHFYGCDTANNWERQARIEVTQHSAAEAGGGGGKFKFFPYYPSSTSTNVSGTPALTIRSKDSTHKGIAINSETGESDYSFYNNGSQASSTSGYFTVPSDDRIKTEVVAISNATAVIKALNPVSFKYTDAYRGSTTGLSDRTYHGVLASNYESVFSAYVTTSATDLITLSDGTHETGEYSGSVPSGATMVADNLKTIQMDPIIFFLIATIKEMEARIVSLEG